MSKIAEAVALIKSICADDRHGYDQLNRWGPDYDCSSLVITVWEKVGVKVKSAGASYTGNMKSTFLQCGFEDVTADIALPAGAGLEPGDVLLNQAHHTAMVIGGGMIAHASLNEKGGITGGVTGDQTGREICTRSYYNYPWDCVLRYKETSKNTPQTETNRDGVYTVRQGDTLWAIAAKTLGDGNRYREIMKENGLVSIFIYPGQRLKIPDVEYKADGTYTVKPGDTLSAIALAKLGKASRYVEIKKLNGLTTDTIYPGQVLKMPD